MLMHHISHSKHATTISFFIQHNINPSKKCKTKGYQYILQNVSNDTIFEKSNI